jgi:hypothetical protein
MLSFGIILHFRFLYFYWTLSRARCILLRSFLYLLAFVIRPGNLDDGVDGWHFCGHYVALSDALQLHNR